MYVRLATLLAGILFVMSILAGSAMNGRIHLRTAQVQLDGVVIQRLTESLPLPFADEPTTASLNRVVISPGETLDLRYYGPVLFYIEEGTLEVDSEKHQLAIVKAESSESGGSDRGIKGGEINSGYGVYSADGNVGPFANPGDIDLVMLAVLFVPQPSESEIEQGSGSTSVTVDPEASPIP